MNTTSEAAQMPLAPPVPPLELPFAPPLELPSLLALFRLPASQPAASAAAASAGASRTPRRDSMGEL
jgi:hypothetical protein